MKKKNCDNINRTSTMITILDNDIEFTALHNRNIHGWMDPLFFSALSNNIL